MSLTEIKSQQFAVRLLKRAVESERFSRAYLFYGPQGVGKEFAAREFAKTINCEEGRKDNCGVCSTCVRIEQNKHPDVLWIYPMGKKRQIKIEQARQLQKFASVKPYEAGYKVGIIQDAHALSPESGNALLKTLEEPPPNTVLVLITHSPETLLPTIRSRLQDVQFFNLPQETVKELLITKAGFSAEDADICSQLSMGSLGRAAGLKNKDVFDRRKLILDALSGGSFGKIKNLTDKVDEILEGLEKIKDDLKTEMDKENTDEVDSKDEDAFIAGEYRKQVEEILGLILSWYRDILIYQNMSKSTLSKRQDAILNKDYMDRITYWEERTSTQELLNRIGIIDSIRESLSRQINIKFLLQVMFVQLGLV